MTVGTKSRTLCAACVLVSAAALASVSTAAAATRAAWQVAELKSSEGVGGLLQAKAGPRRTATEVVVGGLTPDVRVRVAASSRACSRIGSEPVGLLGTTYGGNADDNGVVVLRFTSRTRRDGARSYLAIVDGAVKACGSLRSLSSSCSARFRSFRLRAPGGTRLVGLVHLTRATPTRWTVSSWATERMALSADSMDLALSPEPLAVVDSEGWDEVPPELMFAFGANGSAGGTVTRDLSKIRSAGVLATRGEVRRAVGIGSWGCPSSGKITASASP